MPELLEVNDLVVHFDNDLGPVEALANASLSVGEREIVALVGESGCGKTTLARAILNVIPSPPGKIVGGRIVFKKQDLLGMDEDWLNDNIRGRAITFVPQDPFSSFNPLFTIGTQMLDIVGPKCMNQKQERANSSRDEKRRLYGRMLDLLRSLRLGAPEILLRKYPHELSGGQRQRIMIAVALLVNPSLVIADEPTTALDVTVQAQIISLFRELVGQQGTSVLYITHDLAVASKIANRIVVMYAGQVVESAPTVVFFDMPAHPYTEKLLECLPNPEGIIRDIPGRVPTLINPPKGCRFHPRCDRRTEKCNQARPPLVEIAPEHWLRCYNPPRNRAPEMNGHEGKKRAPL